MMELMLSPCGDSAITASLGESIDPTINARIRALAAAIEAEPFRGYTECLPAYCALTVQYDCTKATYFEVSSYIEHLFSGTHICTQTGKTVEIPVCYGGNLGEDLPFVAQHSGMSECDVIKLHSSCEYPVYMLGFSPGFPYLGGMDERLNMPRLTRPRTSIPAGSVGIAGSQTGVYPISSPGGWQLIGRTPLKLFDLHRKQPFLLSAGDTVRFVPIDEREFERIYTEVHNADNN